MEASASHLCRSPSRRFKVDESAMKVEVVEVVEVGKICR